MKTIFKSFKGKLTSCATKKSDALLEYNVANNSYGDEAIGDFFNKITRENEGKLCEIHLAIHLED